jgi:hypothetical protein
MDAAVPVQSPEPTGGALPLGAVVVGSVCLVTVAAYASSLSGGFVYEDAVLTDRAWLPRWLVRVSHGLAGESAFVQRSVNLGWHLLNGLLLWLLARRLGGCCSRASVAPWLLQVRKWA